MDTGTIALTFLALLLSVGNLLIAFGRSRVNKEEVDTQALTMAIRLAERTPMLEQALVQCSERMHEALRETADNRTKIASLDEVIVSQAEEIQALKHEYQRLRRDLDQLNATLHSLQAMNREAGHTRLPE